VFVVYIIYYFIKIPSISIVIFDVVFSKTDNLIKYAEFLASFVNDLSKVLARISAFNLNKV
jgi:hypothetical protein